jgi:GH35 family endo-1,4-beta-xylanase
MFDMKTHLIVYLVFLSFATVHGAETGSAHEVLTHEGRRLREIVAERFPDNNVFIGATSSYGKMNSPEGDLLAREFRYTTPDNEFKQSTVHPEPEVWSWEGADAWIAFARKHNQLIRIHGPIGPQSSEWACATNRTPEELERNMTEHLTALCKRYNGVDVVKWMDVVNETVERTAQWYGRPPRKPRRLPWIDLGFETDIPAKYKTLQDGVPRYIIKCFQIANEHAPDIKLVLNQHTYMDPAIWDKIKDLVLYLREVHGLRIDALGWQAHLHPYRGGFWEVNRENMVYLGSLIDWAHAHGLEFHITENNIHHPVDSEIDPATYEDSFATILATLLSRRNGGVVAWNLWDIPTRPHYRDPSRMKYSLWDESYRPTASYYRIQDLLEHPPETD